MTLSELKDVQWSGQVIYRAEDYNLGIRWECPSLEELVLSQKLPNFEETDEPAQEFVSVQKDGERFRLSVGDTSKGSWTRDGLAHPLRSAIQLEIATYAPDAVFVHAGVVRWKDQLLVLPGRSFAGKSTLVHALLDLGAHYYSDEYAVVDSEGLVRPWPRPISLRDGNKRDNTPASELGWQPDFGPCPVALVVVANYRQGAEWDPEVLTPAQGVMELLSNTVSAQISPERALKYLPLLATAASCLKGERGEAPDTARALLDSV